MQGKTARQRERERDLADRRRWQRLSAAEQARMMRTMLGKPDPQLRLPV